MTLKVTVKNKGKAPLYQLRAHHQERQRATSTRRSSSSARSSPGETKTGERAARLVRVSKAESRARTKPVADDAKRVCKIPHGRRHARRRRAACASSPRAREPPRDAEIRPTVIQALEQPIFAYTYQVADNRPGNGDGQVAKRRGRHACT